MIIHLFKKNQLIFIVKSLLVFTVSTLVKIYIVPSTMCAASAAGVLSPFFFFPAFNVFELHHFLKLVSEEDIVLAADLLNLFPRREATKIIGAETFETAKQFGLTMSRSKKFQFLAIQQKLNQLDSPKIEQNSLFQILPPELVSHLNTPS